MPSAVPEHQRTADNHSVDDIKNVTELFVLAQERLDEGQRDLSNYIHGKGKAKIEETIALTWEMRKAKDDLKRKTMSRMEILGEYLNEGCVEGCDGKWYDLAIDLITQNELQPFFFAKAVWDLLKRGRKKHLNLMITGPSNCGKTFLLQPLHDIFKVFANPAQNKFAWKGIEDAEVIFLNDFHWSAELIPFDTFLRLLEGDKQVKLSSPKNHFSQDILLTGDAPVFATSGASIKYSGSEPNPDELTKHMDNRWNVLKFFKVIKQEDEKEVPSCKACFANLVKLGDVAPGSEVHLSQF